MRQVKRLLVLVGFAGLGACTLGGAALHPMMHPSAKGDVNTAGVGVGGIYAFGATSGPGSSQNLLSVPYGEGWARFSSGSGQLELRVTPALGYLGYRANILSSQENSVGIAVIPSMGVGYWRTGFKDDQDSDSSSILALAPNVSLLLSFSDGHIYVAPRFGYLSLRNSYGGNKDSEGIISMGLNAGYIIDTDPFKVSLELGLQRVTSTEDDADGATHVITPSIGVQL